MSPPASYRIERDGMGEVRVPQEVLYGTQTQRAVDNFPISGLRMPPRLIHSLGIVQQGDECHPPMMLPISVGRNNPNSTTQGVVSPATST